MNIGRPRMTHDALRDSMRESTRRAFAPPATYSLNFTTAGDEGTSFACAERYTRQFAFKYAHLVSRDIARMGFATIEVIPGVFVNVISVLVLTPEGTPA